MTKLIYASAGLLQEYPLFDNCTSAPWQGCNASQYAQWRGWGDQFLAHLNASLQGALPPQQMHAVGTPYGSHSKSGPGHGGFFHSCPTHGSCISGRCTSVRILNGTGPSGYETLLAWWQSSVGNVWAIDDAWPSPTAWPLIRPPNYLCPLP